jgi:hypothetical protein
MFEDGADLHGELLAAFAALLKTVPNGAFRTLDAGLAADAGQIIDATRHCSAVRAHNAARPHDALHELERLGFIVEVGSVPPA